MRKFLVIAGLLLACGPASAGCFNYSESTTASAPEVDLCIGGKCERTSVEVECSNVHSTMTTFRNGVSVSVNSDEGDGTPVIDWKGRAVKATEMSCKEADPDDSSCSLFSD